MLGGCLLLFVHLLLSSMTNFMSPNNYQSDTGSSQAHHNGSVLRKLKISHEILHA